MERKNKTKATAYLEFRFAEKSARRMGSLNSFRCGNNAHPRENNQLGAQWRTNNFNNITNRIFFFNKIVETKNIL